MTILTTFKDRFEEFVSREIADSVYSIEKYQWLNALTEIDKEVENIISVANSEREWLLQKEINRLKNCMDKIDKEKAELVEALKKVIHSATDENITTEEYFTLLKNY